MLGGGSTWRVDKSLFDAFGNTTETIDPTEHQTEYQYNAEHELVLTSDGTDTATPRLTTSQIDIFGETTATIDPAGDQTDVSSTTTASQSVTTNRAELGSSNWRVTTTLYDAYGDATSTIDPNGDVIDTAFDADGEPTQTTGAADSPRLISAGPPRCTTPSEKQPRRSTRGQQVVPDLRRGPT